MHQKKRILVLISEGGGGHLSAGIAISEALQKEYSVEIVNVFDKILYSIDPLRNLTLGRYNAEKLYNFFLRRGWNPLINLYSMFGTFMGNLLTPKIQKLFSDYLIQKNPSVDLIISTLPFVNRGVVLATGKLSIPFLIVPTDLDTTTFLNGFLKKGMPLSHLTFALAYDDAAIRQKTIQNSWFEDQQIVTLGFPVRKGFRSYSPEEKKMLERELREQCGMHLTRGHKVITLLMGRRGADALFKQAKVIAGMTPAETGLSLEVNIVVGDHRGVGEKIVHWLEKQGAERLPPLKGPQGNPLYLAQTCVSLRCKSGNVMHVRGFTPNIDRFFVCSDLVITKTGSCSVNEVIYTRTKLLLDNTKRASARHLKWEKFNVDFVKQRRIDGASSQIGDAYESIAELKSKIIACLLDEPQDVFQGELTSKASADASLSSFKLPLFSEEIQKVVQKIL